MTRNGGKEEWENMKKGKIGGKGNRRKGLSYVSVERE